MQALDDKPSGACLLIIDRSDLVIVDDLISVRRCIECISKPLISRIGGKVKDKSIAAVFLDESVHIIDVVYHHLS